MNTKKAFSLAELLVSLIIISVILATLAPVISKKLHKSKSALQQLGLTKNCTQESIGLDSECTICLKSTKTCLSCNKTCTSNQYLDTGNCTCVDCPENCSSCSETGCKRCSVGYGISDAGCVECTSGYYSSAGTECKQCPEGTYSSGSKASSCAVCPNGSYCSSGSSTPVTCTNGTYSTSGSGSCTSCEANYYCTSGVKYSCPAYSTSSSGSTSISSCTCINGYYKSGNNCVICPEGSYCTGGSKTSCGTNKTSSSGATSSSSCGCVSGTYSLSGSCVSCAYGKYLNSSGSCVSCPLGTYSNSTSGTASCTTCPSGTYTTSAGATTCVTCPAGYYCQNGVKFSCGTYCTACNSSTGECTSCESGHYIVNETCSDSTCTDFGKYCTACNSSGCTSCTADYMTTYTYNDKTYCVPNFIRSSVNFYDKSSEVTLDLFTYNTLEETSKMPAYTCWRSGTGSLNASCNLQGMRRACNHTPSSQTSPTDTIIPNMEHVEILIALNNPTLVKTFLLSRGFDSNESHGSHAFKYYTGDGDIESYTGFPHLYWMQNPLGYFTGVSAGVLSIVPGGHQNGLLGVYGASCVKK